jgi:Ni/Co efflux regulator RcnB
VAGDVAAAQTALDAERTKSTELQAKLDKVSDRETERERERQRQRQRKVVAPLVGSDDVCLRSWSRLRSPVTRNLF